ncbi:MAG: hypothetical protein R2728_04445 [Chitinophagales bacterium]
MNEESESIIRKKNRQLVCKPLIKRDENGLISLLSLAAFDEFRNRQSSYEIELNNLSAQTDLLKDFGLTWTVEESKNISMDSQCLHCKSTENLKDINASIINNNFYNISENGKQNQELLC